MIRCEHCGSALPDGAIFCGECGRAVTATANRRPAATAPVEQAPPPPLLQPDVHGRRPDPATDAWLPEATLDPATRAWLSGSDRDDAQRPASSAARGREDAAPRPAHEHGSGSGQWTPPAVDAGVGEPPLDPDAFAPGAATAPGEDDPEVTRVAERSGRRPGNGPASGAAPVATGAGGPGTAADPVAEQPSEQPARQGSPSWSAAPTWQPPAPESQPAAPSTPSWWIGRSTPVVDDAEAAASGSAQAGAGQGATAPGAAAPSSAVESPVHDVAGASDEGAAVPPSGVGHDPAEGVPSPPQPGDTAVVEPLVDRRPAPQRPAPLVTPGAAGATCHVCGHALEPDDIFCNECGAVRPAVTAAFTGPIVPLPVARPDWAAVHDDESADDDGDGSAAGDGRAADGDGRAADDESAVGEGGAADDGRGLGGRTVDAAREGEDVGGAPAGIDGESDGVAARGAAGSADDGSTTPADVDRAAAPGEPSEIGAPFGGDPEGTGSDATHASVAGQGEQPVSAAGDDPLDAEAAQAPDDQLFRAAVRPRGLHAAPAPDAAGGDGPVDPSASTPEPGPGRELGSAPTSAPAPRAAPLPPIPGRSEPATAPGSATTPGSAPIPGSTTNTGAVAPLRRPADPASAGAGADDGEAPDEEAPDVEETRIVSNTPTHAPFVLHFSTGERFGVHGTGLLGRLPRPQPGERFDDLLTIHDPGKSVSKTHLELGRDGGDLWVSDRFSGNGTVVRHIDGSIRRCEPGRRYRVERGARVDIGEQFFLVQ